MGATPEELEREIVETREDLARTISAIEERVRPKRLLREHLTTVVGVGLIATALVALKIARKHHG